MEQTELTVESEQETGRLKYYAIIVPDTDGGPPHIVEGSDLGPVLDQTYRLLTENKDGWAYLFNGSRLMISNPRQVISVKDPLGKVIDVTEPIAFAYDANGRFSTLKV